MKVAQLWAGNERKTHYQNLYFLIACEGEPQLQKRGRLTTLHDSNAAENREPRLQNK